MSGSLDLRLVPLILSLGLDTFALSVVLGMAVLPLRARLRLAVTFAAAEGLMPAAGVLLGRSLGQLLGQWSTYVAAALLVATGLWIAREGLERDGDDDGNDDDGDDEDGGGEAAVIHRAAAAGGLPLVGLAISVSLDELAAGISFGLLHVPLAPALAVIALQALCVSLAGLWLGRRVGAVVGERAELLAGVVLCLWGVGLAIAHLAGLAAL